MNNEPIAIIDMDCLFPGGQNLESYWHTVFEAQSQLKELPSGILDPEYEFGPDAKDPSKSVNRTGGWFQPPKLALLKLGIPPKTARMIDRSQLELLEITYRMLERSHYGPRDDYDRTRARIAMGTAPIGPLIDELEGHLQGRRLVKELSSPSHLAFLEPQTRVKVIEELSGLIEERYPRITSDSTTGYSPATGVGRLANRLDFRGGYTSITTACASSLMAVYEGCRWLRAYESDIVLAGGTDYSLTTLGLITFSAARAVSPTGCYPFDMRADGTLLGVGCGVLLLKRLSDARRDDDSVIATLLGGGISSDGRGETLTQPSVDGIVRMIQNTLKDSDSPLTSIQYLEAHATGTPTGDKAELSALQKLSDMYGVSQGGLALGAVKQIIGHTRAAAGIASLIKAALAIKHRVIPPMKHIKRPRLPLVHGSGTLHYCDEPIDWKCEKSENRKAVVTALGFGGINCGLVLGEPE